MTPIKTPRSNRVYTLPGGTPLNDLPVELREDGICSTWELTPEERMAVAEGANIELMIYDYRTPPVSLAVASELRDTTP